MRTLVALAAVAGLAVAANPVAAQPAARKPGPPPAAAPYRVAGIHAFLYFHRTGTFGDKDLTGPGVALWNTIIGEGDAGMPATAMLVKIELAGPTFSNIDGKLTVVARAGKQTLAKQVFALGDFFDEHSPTITVPMLVAGVGCAEVAITATLSGKGKKGAATAVVPFSCGE